LFRVPLLYVAAGAGQGKLVKLLIVQLGDIHFRSADDPVLSRTSRIVDAVKNLHYGLDGCIIVFAGDIAHAATEEQYLLAFDFAAGLRRGVLDAWKMPVPVKFATVPGNHDCDFSADLPARDAVLGAGHPNPTQPTIDLCTEVQDSFFEWRDALNDGDLTVAGRLYYEYVFRFGPSTVLVRCMNTAWLSRIHEKAGTLYYPESKIPTHPDPHTVAVSMFHHPYNWLQPDNLRAFRNRVEEVSDIILTGHDHDFAKRHTRGERGEVNLYIEGCALQQAAAPNDSAFNCILLDSETKRQRVLCLKWNGARYSETKPQAEWEPYQVNRLRARDKFEVLPEFAAYLEDPGITLGHLQKTKLSLSDVFVHPDLREVIYKQSVTPDIIRGDGLLDFVATEGRVLITGAEKAGKTSLAKRLFRTYFDKGYVPLLLDGAELRVFDDDRTYNEFEKNFAVQYQAEAADAYKQLDRDRRVLIVDDFHKLRLRRASLDAALAQMSHFSGRVILLAHDLAQQVNELVGSAPSRIGAKAFPHYRIQPFGHARQNELAEKWFSMARHPSEDDEAFSRKIIDAKRMMDTAIGRNFVPSYPIFILPILQAQEAHQNIDINASTYGYFYELLIRRALALGSTREGFDVKLGYLTHLAYSLFANKTPELTDRELRRIHADYEAVYALDVSFAAIVSDFAACGILEERGDKYYFKYKYYYYYFVASYLRDHIQDEPIQRQVATLADTLHEEDSANILLFLAHLSKHPVVVEQMLRRAAAVFTEATASKLSADESPLPELDKTLEEIVYEETPEQREKYLRRLDQLDQERARAEEDEAFRQSSEYISKIGVAFRTLQILGQIVKNFPGSMPGEQKRAITRACYNVGLRTLGSLLGALKLTKDEFVRSFVEAIRADDPHLNDEELSKRARETVHGLTHIGAYGMVKRISHAVGSPHLKQVYDSLSKEDPSPAVALIHASLQLDQAQSFPEDEVEDLGKRFDENPLASRVLKSLVINHFHLFTVKYDTKQHICSKLGIPYKPLQAADPRVRLVGRPQKVDKN
jgi:hypothetical protein